MTPQIRYRNEAQQTKTYRRFEAEERKKMTCDIFQGGRRSTKIKQILTLNTQTNKL